MPYTVDCKQTAYSVDIGREYIAYKQSQADNGVISKGMILEIGRAVRLLDDIFLYGEIRSHRKKVLPPLTGAIGSAMNDFLDYLRAERRSPLTVEGYHRYLYFFLIYLTDRGIDDIQSVTTAVILEYLSGEIVSKLHVVRSLRCAFRYWALEGIVGFEILNVFNMVKPQKDEQVPDTFSEDEIHRILGSVERTSSRGIRNYAMLTLAVFYGIRPCDIAGFRLEYGKGGAV